jgi:hypothetical protein
MNPNDIIQLINFFSSMSVVFALLALMVTIFNQKERK